MFFGEGMGGIFRGEGDDFCHKLPGFKLVHIRFAFEKGEYFLDAAADFCLPFVFRTQNAAGKIPPLHQWQKVFSPKNAVGEAAHKLLGENNAAHAAAFAADV